MQSTAYQQELDRTRSFKSQLLKLESIVNKPGDTAQINQVSLFPLAFWVLQEQVVAGAPLHMSAAAPHRQREFLSHRGNSFVVRVGQFGRDTHAGFVPISKRSD